MRRILPALAAVALTVLSVAPASAEVWTRRYELRGRPSVRIVTDDFRVKVHTRASGPVEFRIEYELHKFGLVRSTPKQPRIEFRQEGDTISLHAEEPNFIAFFATVETHSTIEVTVPVDADVSVRTGDGSIECETLRGSTTLETGDGHIRANGLQGATWLRTGDGSIEGFDLAGGLIARSGDGHIDVDGRFDRLDVTTGDGRVRAVARPGSRVREGWNLETRDGSLSLRIPLDLKAFLDARTGDGRLRVDLPITQAGSTRRHEISGQLNGGGGPLRVRTADGTLTLGVSN